MYIDKKVYSLITHFPATTVLFLFAGYNTVSKISKWWVASPCHGQEFDEINRLVGGIASWTTGIASLHWRGQFIAIHIHDGWMTIPHVLLSMTQIYMGMDQYLWIPFLVGWTSIYQLFWCSPGVQDFDTLPYWFLIWLAFFLVVAIVNCSRDQRFLNVFGYGCCSPPMICADVDLWLAKSVILGCFL